MRTKAQRVAAKRDPWTEHDHQVMLFAWSRVASRRHPELAGMFAIPNAGGFTGGYRQNVARVVSMKREGVKPGVPDICLPYARGIYNALYVELKKADAKPSDTKPAQREWHERLRDAGNAVVVAQGWEAARNEIEAYLTLTPINP